MQIKKQMLCSTVAGCAMSAVLASTAYAQDSAAAADAFELEEIVVTATKRSESLQEVPLSITALTGENLKRLGADRFEDYLAQAPGVAYTSSGIVNAKPTIRGIATSSFPGQGQAAVGIYIDELPSLSRAFPFANTDLRTFDIERVEILRGPQGTLFGSGSAGGAIRVITNKPDTGEFAGKVEVGFGAAKGGEISQNYNGMINVPLAEDALALRVVGYYRDEGGYIDNIVQNKKNTGGREAQGGRAMLEYNTQDALTLRFSATYQKDNQDTAAPFGLLNPADGGIDEYDTAGVAPSEIELAIYNFTGEYDFGNVGLFVSTSYGKTKARLGKDNGAFVQSLLETTEEVSSGQDVEAKTFSQEIRLSSQYEGPFQWLVGGFYLDQSFDILETWSVPAIDQTPVHVNIKADTRELALFGEMNYAFTDRLKLTAGARLFNNRGNFYNLSRVFGTETIKDADPAKETSITPRFSLSYQANDDLNFYATAAKGYRVGRANFTFPADPETGEEVPDAYESDNLWNYELGMKSVWMDNRLKFNAALYYIDWKNIQLGREIGDAVITDNAGDATSQGVELELQYVASNWLSYGATYSYTDAELVTVLPGTFATPGSRLPGTPKSSWSSHVELTKDAIIGDADGYLRLDHRYSGSRFQDLDNEESYVAESYHLFNMRAGLQWDSYELVVYADNLFNERVPLQAFTDDGFDSDNAIYTRPRTIGITFRADF